jgi:DNA-binding PadR family transcriptional regulator
MLLDVLRDGPGYGLDLCDRVLARFGVSIGPRIYPPLRALEREGVLVSYEGTEVVPERGGRPRRYYRLAGARVLTVPRREGLSPPPLAEARASEGGDGGRER